MTQSLASLALLRHWQQTQEVHDRGFHMDIFTLPLKQRLAHMALHFSKYVGRFAREGVCPSERTVKTVTDVALIALSASNALRLNLQATVGAIPTLTEATLLAGLADPTGHLCDAVEKLDHLEQDGPPYADAVTDIVRWTLAAAVLYNIDLDAAIEARRKQIRESRTHIGLRAIA